MKAEIIDGELIIFFTKEETRALLQPVIVSAPTVPVITEKPEPKFELNQIGDELLRAQWTNFADKYRLKISIAEN